MHQNHESNPHKPSSSSRTNDASLSLSLKSEEDEEAKTLRREEGKARYEAKLQGKKWHRPVDLSALDSTSSRTGRVDVASMVGKSTLVPAGSVTGKRGRGAGFYCDACDLTYKDNVQYIEHLNSKQHLIATGQSGDVVRATVEDVRDRLEMLRQRKREREEEEMEGGVVDLDARVRKTEEVEGREREEKRRKRNEKRRKRGADGKIKGEDDWESRLGIIC